MKKESQNYSKYNQLKKMLSILINPPFILNDIIKCIYLIYINI